MTPDFKNGICVILRDCASLFRIILDFRTSSSTQRDFLRRSQCDESTSSNPVVINLGENKNMKNT